MSGNPIPPRPEVVSKDKGAKDAINAALQERFEVTTALPRGQPPVPAPRAEATGLRSDVHDDEPDAE
jgi:hypothetical protein